jgi:hypothetical protein
MPAVIVPLVQVTVDVTFVVEIGPLLWRLVPLAWRLRSKKPVHVSELEEIEQSAMPFY